ncbi:MAG: hypothetical protein IJT27_04990 [Clostridia bacterium]|nr:hypothetical protein [Clostridia bacterium]
MELIHCFFLRLFRSTNKHPIITQADFEKIKEIFLTAYEDGPAQLSNLNTQRRLLTFCFAARIEQVYFKRTDNWFIVVTSLHNCYNIVEFAAVNGKCDDIFGVIAYLMENFKHKPFIADCRETTSYPLILSYARAGRVKILGDVIRVREGENMHLLKFKILKHKAQRLQ